MRRSSQSHPLRIAELPVGAKGGAIGVTFAPGKVQEVALTGSWSRDVDIDMAAIRDWGASHLVSLLEPWEFEELQISTLPEAAAKVGVTWHGLPITDGEPPDKRLLEKWKNVGATLVAGLLAGSRVVVHCKGGLGRAGTVAAMLLLDTGTTSSAVQAMQMVRRVRPGAIETSRQEAFLLQWERQQTRS